MINKFWLNYLFTTDAWPWTSHTHTHTNENVCTHTHDTNCETSQDRFISRPWLHQCAFPVSVHSSWMAVIHGIPHLERNNSYEGPRRMQFIHYQNRSKLSNHLSSLPLAPINSGVCQKPSCLILLITVNINKDGGANEKKMCFSAGETIPPPQNTVSALRFH